VIVVEHGFEGGQVEFLVVECHLSERKRLVLLDDSSYLYSLSLRHFSFELVDSDLSLVSSLKNESRSSFFYAVNTPHKGYCESDEALEVLDGYEGVGLTMHWLEGNVSCHLKILAKRASEL
jgi:hypothetical protein